MDIHFGLGPGFKYQMGLLLISPCDLLINVTLNVSMLNVSFADAFLIQSFHTDNFSGQQLALANIW